jgi:hypothetical protein
VTLEKASVCKGLRSQCGTVSAEESLSLEAAQSHLPPPHSRQSSGPRDSPGLLDHSLKTLDQIFHPPVTIENSEAQRNT